MHWGESRASPPSRTPARPPSPWLPAVSYKPFGPLSGFTFGNSVAAAFTYDQDYQLTDIDAAKTGATVQDLTNGYDASGNITSITDHIASCRTQTVTYDNLNRVYTASGLYGSQSYTYDGVGNRLTRVIGGTTDTYAYSSTANQISTITTGSNVRSFTYQASGQTSGDVRNPSNNYTFTYNNNGRSITAKLNGSTVGSYTYNAFEQRVQKVAGGVTTQFVFDRFGHLLEEANGSGVAQKEYIWLDDLPVAMVNVATNTIYFIHTDQLGTPQKITDGAANVVWDGIFDPFGNAITITGANWGTGVWNSFNWAPTSPPIASTNLRFPGQFFDTETVLSQNWNRDYDPTIGRYIQSDPIGLLGGINTYGYAQGNPNTKDDPRGEFWPYVAAALGIGIVAFDEYLTFEHNSHPPPLRRVPPPLPPNGVCTRENPSGAPHYPEFRNRTPFTPEKDYPDAPELHEIPDYIVPAPGR